MASMYRKVRTSMSILDKKQVHKLDTTTQHPLSGKWSKWPIDREFKELVYESSSIVKPSIMLCKHTESFDFECIDEVLDEYYQREDHGIWLYPCWKNLVCSLNNTSQLS